MIKRNPYITDQMKSPTIAKYFPDSLEDPLELWPKERLEAYQTESLKEILTHAYENNQYYKEKFDAAGVSPSDFNTLKDLKKFPFLTKDEIRGNPWLLLATSRDKISQIHVSTGTTGGIHSYIVYTWDDIYVNELAIQIPLLVHTSSKDIVINALPYEMSSAGMAFHRSFQNGTCSGVANVGKGGFYSDPHKTLQIAKDLDANVLITTPPYALYMSELAKDEMNLDPQKDFNFRFIWLTGEGCSDAYRKRLEQIWGCPCLMYYGSLEAGPIGIECLMQNGYHLTEGHVYVEVIHPKTGKPLPPGAIGEICVTVLYKKGTPMIRYRVQDLGFIDTSECPCCMERPRVVLRGREQDQIKIGTKSYSPYYLEDLLYKIPEVGNNYVFEVHPDGLVIKFELAEGVERSQSICEKVRSRLAFYVGEIKDTCIEDHIPRTMGKTKRVVYVES